MALFGKRMKVGLAALFIALVGSVPQTASAVSQKRGSALTCADIEPIVERGFLLNHVTYHHLTPNLEKRTITQYIKKLDPSKRYLLLSDVMKIRHDMAHIYRDIKNKNCKVLLKVQDVFYNRMKEREAFVKKTLADKNFKFDPKTEISLEASHRKWPRNLAAANAFQRKFLQFQIANYLADGMKLPEAKKHVIASYDRALSRINDIRIDDVYVNYLDAFARSLDPHSDFFDLDSTKDFDIEMSLSLQGIGATLTSRDGFTVVDQLIPGGAAAQSGLLHPQDKIIAVRRMPGKPLENVIDMDLRNVVDRIRGPKGTKVELTILRKVGDKQIRKNITLTREKISLKQEAASIHFVHRKIDGKDLKIGVLNLPSFYADTRAGGRSCANDVEKLLKKAREQHADGLILDLSNNGGGSLEDAVRIAGFFFKTGNVVKQSSGYPGRPYETLADVDPDVNWPGPLVVLTSRISASASEIVSGTLHDYKRAIIVGADHTWGKGTVQSVMNLTNIGSFRVTVGMFFTPSGYSTQHRGVRADVILPGPYSTPDVGEKSLDYSLPPKKIPSFISKSAYVTKGPDAWQTIKPWEIRILRKKSAIRVAKNPKFKKILAEIKKAEKNKSKMIKVSEVLKDETKADKERSEPPKTQKQELDTYLSRPDIREAESVLGDYINLLAKKHGSKSAVARK